MDASIAAVLTAAGSSSRMGGLKKEYLPLGKDGEGRVRLDGAGRPLTVLGAAVRAFAASARVGIIVIAVPAGGGEEAARASLPPEFRGEGPGARVFLVPGGATRRASVHRALDFLSPYNPSYVLIHDGARPWVEGDLIERIIDGAARFRAVVPVLPLAETPKELDGEGFVKRHLRRSRVGAAQTPQGFAFPAILRAHERAAERELREGLDYTDDAEVWGEFQGPVAVIPGSPANRKITFPGDLP
jgi:2-C-methyl-D-erythritol 4-phosphate cytidylyltransferase